MDKQQRNYMKWMVGGIWTIAVIEFTGLFLKIVLEVV